MLTEISYTKRIRYLFVVIGVLIIVFYKVGVRKSIQLKMEEETLESQLKIVNDAPAKLLKYQSQVSKLNEFIKSGDPDLGSEQLLLKFISKYVSQGRLQLLQMPEPVYTNSAGISTQTNSFTVSGPYSEVMSLIYDLECKNNFCKIISVLFKRVKDMQRHDKKLQTTVYVRSVI